MSRLPADQTRVLPQTPSLEHLRNEAKALLKAARRDNPVLRLSDTQRDLARSYGFSGWRSLKRYVDAVADVGARLVAAVATGDAPAIGQILGAHPLLADAAVDMTERIRPSDERAMRLIHLAVGENRFDAAQALIRHGADLNLRNAGGRTALHDCFELQRDGIRDLLLAAGAVVDVCAAAAYGMEDRLADLLAFDPSLANDLSTGIPPLGWAAYGRAAGAAGLLIEAGAILDRPPHDGGNWAAASDVASVDVTRIMLASGADPNWRNRDGDTPLHLAVRSRLVREPADFVAAMLAGGADASIRNLAGRTALDECVARSGSPATDHETQQPIGAKQLDRSMALLHAAMGGAGLPANG